MSAVFEAHLRMLESLPRRTHEWKAPLTERLTVEKPDAKLRRERIRELLAQGISSRRMVDIVKISRTAIQKHIRAIKRGK